MSAVGGVGEGLNEAARKPASVRLDPQLAVNVVDPAIASGNVASRRSVVDVASHGSGAPIVEQGRRCLAVEPFPRRQRGQVRVIVTSEPEEVHQLRLE